MLLLSLMKSLLCLPNKVRFNPDTIYARYNTEVGKDNKIPLWLLGFLY